MRLSNTVLMLFVVSSFAAAGHIAPLGKKLGERYQTLRPDEKEIVIIYFADKGDRAKVAAYDARQLVSERSLKRRLKTRPSESLVDAADFPLEQAYVRAVGQNVVMVRHQLKWFNAVSAVATRRQMEVIRTMPFVKEIDLVGRWKRDASKENLSAAKGILGAPRTQGAASLDYGPSFTQLNQINVPAVHDLGFYGQGVVICMFDDGVRLQTHEAFGSMNIIAQHDFVDHKASVVPYDPSAGWHGTSTLSAIGGYKPGQLIGPAFKADFILARTENDSSETPIEEDNWAKGIEWADSIGVDVTSTSLVYLTFNPPYTSWTWQNMDGNTTLITRAADRAVGLGIVVVNAAGNSGYNASHNTLMAPADGDSVITAGAVDASGSRASFSSVGPTFDGRIKPDIMAMGVSDYLASAGGNSSYGSGDGTSFSCPLSAGVAALVLCANPHLTPMQVREAMRQTASNAGSPNNLIGWGILNALAAVNYYGSSPHVTGMAFEDVNGNGQRDPGEPRVQGVTFRLSGASAESTVTDVHGVYLFDTLALGHYVLSENVPSGWVLTSNVSNADSVTLDSLTKSVGRQEFGNFRLGAIHGVVFEDFNANGAMDPGEHGLAGVKISLSGGSAASTITDSAGNFSFTGVGPGTTAVSESLASGRVQTLPAGNFSVVMHSGIDTTGLNFGVFRFGTIRGLVFNDANGNGVRDSGEVGLARWNVHLNGPVSAVDTTDSTGNFVFANLGPGTYTVSESTHAGWFLTLPSGSGTSTVTMTSGLDSTGFAFGNFYPSTVGYYARAGWNLLSLPLRVTDGRRSSIYPSSQSSAFIYGHGYKIADTIVNNIGYWLKFASFDSIPIHGEQRFLDTVHVRQGWNLIGTLSVPVAVENIIQTPDSILKPFFSYDAQYGTYNILTPFDTLFPNRGYWVKASSNGEFVLSSGGMRIHPAVVPSIVTSLESMNMITVQDRDGKSRTLYFGGHEGVPQDVAVVELPPRPPQEAFDVRFSNGFAVWVSPKGSGDASVPIDIQGARFPLEVSWDLKGEGGSYTLSYESASDAHTPSWDIEVSGTGNVTITDSHVRILNLKKNGSSTVLQTTPKEFQLEQNYPNPFNPTTVIGYQLPVQSYVTLRVYNVLGQEVRTLVDGIQDAGVSSVGWGATNNSGMSVPSGLYFYRLEAAGMGGDGKSFVKVRKMLMMK
ncbi:MAG: SdrD B-like domain-containing protein [Bacteroidota bacterium]